jgi:membrane protease subunit HflK
MDRLRGLFDGGGGNPLRWIWIAGWPVAAVQQLPAGRRAAARRGAALRPVRAGDAAGPQLQAALADGARLKVNATQIKTFSNTVPVLTRDENIVNVEINVQYRIGDPRLYLFGTRDADEMLKQAAQSTVREQVGPFRPGHRARRARRAGGDRARRLQKSLATYRTGLAVTELNLPNARPPEEVKPAFDDVNSAQQDKDRLISEGAPTPPRWCPRRAARPRARAPWPRATRPLPIARATGDATRFSLLASSTATRRT